MNRELISSVGELVSRQRRFTESALGSEPDPKILISEKSCFARQLCWYNKMAFLVDWFSKTYIGINLLANVGLSVTFSRAKSTEPI